MPFSRTVAKMPYKDKSDKLAYMKKYDAEVVCRLFELVSYENFSDNEEMKKKIRKVEIKYKVFFFQVWHDDHMQHVVYTRKKLTQEKILRIAIEAGLEPSNGVIIMSCKKLSDALRYLLHLDDKDKAQYSPDDFILINGGADPLDKIIWTKEELEIYVFEISDFIKNNGITTASALQNFLGKSRIYKFIYRKQAYKQDIDNLVADNMRCEDKLLQKQMLALQQQIVEQTKPEQKESVSSKTRDEKSIANPYSTIEHNQHDDKPQANTYIDNLDDDEYWDTIFRDYRRDCWLRIM